MRIRGVRLSKAFRIISPWLERIAPGALNVLLSVRALTLNPDDSIPTRKSLLSRLKNWDDQESWRQFFDTYWQLIHRVARKAGLREDEAQDVVQETILSVAKKMPGFKYDRAQGSFRGWLCQLTRWRIINQFKKRRGEQDDSGALPETVIPLEEIADATGGSFEECWEQEWKEHLLSLAIARVKGQASAGQYQIFDLCVNKRLAVAEISAALGVNAGQIYLAKHRVSSLLKKELKRLETEIL